MNTGLRIRVLMAVLALLLTTNIQAQTTNPPYLNQMPSVARVRAEIKGTDALDTGARQMGAFEQLMGIINALAGPRYKSREFTPDENRVKGQYFNAWQRFQYKENAPLPQDQPRWAKLRAFYENDPGFRDELLQQFFSAEFRTAYYRAVGKPASSQSPIQAAPEAGSGPSQPTASAANSAEAYKIQGDKYREAKDYAKAIEAYKKAIALNPTLVKAHGQLGGTYLNQQNYPFAISAYQKCLSLDPNDASCFLDLGTAYLNSKQYDDALKLYAGTAGRKLDADTAAQAYYTAGWTYIKLKQYQNALEPLQAALRVRRDPKSVWYWHGYAGAALGLAYLNLRQYPQAVVALQGATRLLPEVEDGGGMYLYNTQAGVVDGIDYVSTYYLLGKAYVGVGNKERASGLRNNPKTAASD